MSPLTIFFKKNLLVVIDYNQSGAAHASREPFTGEYTRRLTDRRRSPTRMKSPLVLTYSDTMPTPSEHSAVSSLSPFLRSAIHICFKVPLATDGA
jgi:hypothetical protein